MPDFNALLKKGGVTFSGVDDLATMSFLLHGEAGTGKTSFAASASKVETWGPVLYIDTENGTRPLLDHGDLDKIDIVRVSSWAEMLTVLAAVKTAVEAGDLEYRTIVLDTVDRLQEYILSHNQDLQEKNGAQNIDKFKLYAFVYEATSATMKAFLNLQGVNFIAITHTTRTTNEITGEVTLAPSFEGQKSGTRLPALFNFVGWFHKERPDDEDDPIVVMTTSAPGLVAKSQSLALPSDIGNPTIAKVLDLLSTNTNKEN